MIRPLPMTEFPNYAAPQLGQIPDRWPQPLVARPSGSRHIVVCEGDRIEMHSPIDRLVHTTFSSLRPENAGKRPRRQG
jgi:hypothetical protein